jgi:hypothetical protein|tara:strand:- start:275 stop:721 length:447 start_codon:yes stop_codon:yes gene_type:complete
MPRLKTDFTQLTQVGEWAWKSELLWSKIKKRGDDECWEWIGSTSTHSNLFGGFKNFYAQMSQAPRFIYMDVHGVPCTDISIKHSCGNKFCANWHHFETYPNNRKFYADGTPRDPSQLPPSLRREKKDAKRAKKPTTMAVKQAREWWEV